MINKSLILSLVLFVAIGISWLLLHNSSVNEITDDSNQANTPDAFMTNAKYTRFNTSGEIQSKLFASRITHYPQQDTSQLISPQLILHANNETTWNISANNGVSTSGTSQVVLRDNVVLKRLNNNSTNDMTITTTELTAFPQRDFAQTQQPVTIVQPGSTIHSIGMTANLNTGDITLLSNARGVYQEQESPP